MHFVAHSRSSLLLIGHPGHELRIYGWISRASPLVCILTDGSGGTGIPRLAETLSLLKEVGVSTGSICGEFSDRQIYAYMLSHSYGVFEGLCERLAEVILTRNIETIVSDGIEGYNPSHDLCAILARTAIALAQREKAKALHLYTFPLMGDPRPCAGSDPSTYLECKLSAAEFRRKLRIIRDYARKGGAMLEQEVEDTLRQFGEKAFAREYLFAADPYNQGACEQRFDHDKPYYESYGETQVAAGRYFSVVRFREHISPLIERLQAMASASC